MQISKIKLNSYLHFAPGLEIDLTYPLGHPKQGQPLEKVCFLGQSATGKTTLLNLIKCCVCDPGQINLSAVDKSALVSGGVELVYKLDGKHYSKVSAGEFQFEHFDRSDYDNPKKIDYVKPFEETLDFLRLKQCSPFLINFPFCVVVPETLNEGRVLNPNTGSLESIPMGDKQVWDFDHATITTVWNIVFNQVESYVKEHRSQQADSFSQITSRPEEAASIITKFKAWETAHPNPIKELSERCLSRILANFNLEIETDLQFYNNSSPPSGRMHIIIKSKATGREIPYDFLSTGTKQIMLTAIPLFYLHPRNTIILFDQPETSLYPNIQCMLPDAYLKTAPNNNQFFFATHSPVIASSFEPWEIVELKFDKNGWIYRKPYFSGKRHMGNYEIKPKSLRWDSAYRILFDVPDDGNEERATKLMELASLQKRIEGTSDLQKKRSLFQQYETLANELDWQIKANA
ncbi:MAG TPA: AAA family ATPase [Verrucomicrobiae bacterium]|jgi:energy-coupling factor transporter ATP-binding protein EcfA2|nr:AAA family ATPase [Verrucomicrobiae bacterium]